LIGLQMRSVLSHIQEHSFGTLLWYGFLISAATILARIIWVFPGAYLPRWFSKKIRQREPDTNVRTVAIVAWSGMRGVVSLAAALALPLTVGENVPFPNRDLIIFLTFAVIFATLVLQGMTLPILVRKLGIKADVGGKVDEDNARYSIASSVIEHIEENYALGLSDSVLAQIKSKYEIRIQRLRKDAANNLTEEQIQEFHRIQRELIKQERAYLDSMYKSRKINDEALRKIEYELDLEEARLELEYEKSAK
jgi:monovalent cation/hydrogen antiporter